MNKEKYCGNCLFFKNEDVLGFGYCWCHENERQVGYCCGNHVDAPEPLSGWAEITPDNMVDALKSKEMLVIAHYIDNRLAKEVLPADVDDNQLEVILSTMTELGGYYYYVLPELKIE